MRSILRWHLISMACILLCCSAVRAYGSQAYRKMDATRERISRILKLRNMLLLSQSGFNLANAAVVCAILESISGFESSSDTTEPRYLKLVTASGFCPFTLIYLLTLLVLCVINLVFMALISMPLAMVALSRRSTYFASSSSPPKPSMLLAKRRLVIVLPPTWSFPEIR